MTQQSNKKERKKRKIEKNKINKNARKPLNL